LGYLDGVFPNFGEVVVGVIGHTLRRNWAILRIKSYSPPFDSHSCVRNATNCSAGVCFYSPRVLHFFVFCVF
jgi:hypothetical protein